ncbi:hypothetical protein [Sphingobacterium deserti]|uniref:Uncharacterized protein n=1 Tax=Sphingobacterium deserti TaxID=1229276 RepID=A0A0B8TC88_9SPHI|nr:hypothetical protein [Sphingobacterium deserti]KGE15955.1 hypothetical protein DI53_0070 [Sphingobacterium deserti]
MMNAATLLLVHSYYRWVVLVAMVIQLYWLLTHARKGSIFSRKHYYVLVAYTLLYDVQLLIGWLLYINSALVDAFLNNISAGVKNRQLRFFGLEHVSMMSLAILLFNVATLRARKKIGKVGIFKSLIKWYLCIYLLILSSIPWSFSPLTSRPNFR